MNNNIFFKIFLGFLLVSTPFYSVNAGVESALFGEDLSSLFQPATDTKVDVPDPSALKLNWFEYIDIKDPQELSLRIATLSKSLMPLTEKLSGQQKESASSYINNILFNLNTLMAERKQPIKDENVAKPLQASYSIEEQLDLHYKLKLTQIKISNEEDELANNKKVIAKKEKQLDALLVAYISHNELSAEKMVAGLEIMAAKTALLVSNEHLDKMMKRLDIENARANALQKEIDAAAKLFDVKNFDVAKLESAIHQAEQDLERKQILLNNTENNLQQSASQTFQDKNSRYLLSQKLIHAAAQRSIAWTTLAFHNLKYNFYMHLNNHLHESNKEMYDKLEDWKEHLAKTSKQIDEWKKAVLREQERVRQDYSMLVAQHENTDSKAMRLNEARRQESFQTFSTIQMLEDEVSNAEWLIDRLETYIRKNSSFFEVSLLEISLALNSAWLFIENCLNFTLFKLGDLPITPLSLFKIVLILTLSYLISKAVSRALVSFGNGKRGSTVTTSSLYTLGRLAHYFILIVGSLVALTSIGFDLSHLLIVASALTLGIGFGLQSFANNFICGLRILFERNLKVGDFIELQNGTYGKVTEIHVQNTIIYTSDGIEVVIPNSELTNQTLINYTMNNNYRRLTIPFTVSADADKELVRRIVIEAANKHYLTAPAHWGTPQVWLNKFDKYNFEFALAVWVDYKKKSQSGSRESEYLWEIESVLRDNGVPLTSSSPTILLAREPGVTEFPIEI